MCNGYLPRTSCRELLAVGGYLVDDDNAEDIGSDEETFHDDSDSDEEEIDDELGQILGELSDAEINTFNGRVDAFLDRFERLSQSDIDAFWDGLSEAEYVLVTIRLDHIEEEFKELREIIGRHHRKRDELLLSMLRAHRFQSPEIERLLNEERSEYDPTFSIRCFRAMDKADEHYVPKDKEPLHEDFFNSI